MKQRYVINVQNVDNLDNVQIEISPFTVFTGDNNSGKSVILNIIYGVLRLLRQIIQNGDKDSDEYRRCKDFIRELKENKEVCIDHNVGKIFCDFFNVSLFKNREYFFKEVFNVSRENNYKRFENTKIFLNNYRLFPKVYVVVDDMCDEVLIEGDYVKIPEEFFNDEDYVLELLCEKIIDNGFSDTNEYKQVFMPSGRSTFLCYANLFQNLKYQNLSMKDFITNIENLDFTNDGIYGSIYKFLEEDILKGSFTKDSYKCHLNNIEIPISMASDSMREIAPFILFLKSKERFSTFFIEEIETYMDLKLQRSVVSALMRLINTGASIFMSTNSNVILDQICNFLLLNNLNRNKIEGFGYILNDVLNADNINIYEFTYDKNKVLVKKLPIDYRGFKVNFNEDILEDISRENTQLQFEMFEK